MEPSAAALAAWGYGFAAGSYILLALYLASLGTPAEGRRRAAGMLAAVGLCALWAMAGWAFAVSGRPFYWVLAVLLDNLRYGAWYAFILLLLGPNAGRPALIGIPPRLGLPMAVGIVAGGMAIHLGALLGLGDPAFLAKAGLLQALVMVVFALLLLEQFFRSVAADSRWNVKPFCLGLAGAFAFDLYVYSDALLFGRLDADAVSIRGFVAAMVVPLLALSTSRSRDWMSRIRLSQKAAFHSLTLLFSGMYLLFMAGVGYYVRYFGGDWGRALQLALVFLAFLGLGVLAFSGAVRAKLRVLVGKHFFSYRYDYREEWLKFTQTLSEQGSPQTMGLHAIRGLADMLESPAGALWLRDAEHGAYTQTARWNMVEVGAREEGGSPFCRFLADSGWVINLEEYRCYARRYEGLDLPLWLSEIANAWLIVPLLVGSEMIGFVVLASPRTPVDVNWEVNDLLKTAGRQAAAFLAQLQATEALLEARKFDAFNRMSAFVVHDLKNIVTQLSLMLKNAEKHKDNPEFQEDMLMTVEHAVERMRQLMLQLREGATPPGTPVGVDLAGIIERIRKGKAAQGRTVDIQVEERLSTRGHEERLERVIGHMVQNALDATDMDGRVWVKLGREGGQARLEVGDTGHGMSAEFIRERLFKPFQTTKQAGMGIGAYESFQYVQELGGKILVDSEVDQGTRVTMLLPLFELAKGSDLQHREAV